MKALSAQLTSGNWMNWKKNDNSQQYFDNHEDAIGEENVPDDEDDSPDDDNNNDDEVDDHIPGDRKKSISSWNFWTTQRDSTNSAEDLNSDSNLDNNNEEPKDKANKKDNNNKKKEKEEKINTNVSNTILPSSQQLVPRPDVNDENPANSEDDAVLYKPHDDAKQFSKINTHKNENLKENVIVPDWDTCLPNQASIISGSHLTSTLFGSTSTSNQNNTNSNKVDLTNWRTFLSQLSTKLGFSSHTLTSVMEDESDGPEEMSDNSGASKDKLEKEFNLLYERTYKLYGRSLAKLPSHKRACLPNYNKYYTKSSDSTYSYNQETQIEEDANDPNSISITNDPMGNLLINHRGTGRSGKPPQIRQAEIVRHKGSSLTKIKKILIIGVHGFFPTKMIRPLIGAPKGTSLKFANEAEKAMIRYCIENRLIDESDSKQVSIQKIALEKEGKILDRVEFFTEILIKWQQELNDADLIFVASHSQGCVVSIILLAKLIRMGILKDAINKRIGILGMAGINNGPFYGVDKSFFMKAYSALEHDSLMELFELTKFNSQQSLVYKESIQVIINSNIKICFIGSINDQLVPLYSAVSAHNMGYFDNNVLKELSTALAGPLTGGGHSKLYNDGKVYDLGIKFVLDTDDIVLPPTSSSKLSNTEPSYEVNSLPKHEVVTTGIGNYGSLPTDLSATEIVKLPSTNQVYIKEFNISKIGTNPFILPWCLRGLLFNIEKNWPNNNKLLSVDKGNEMGKTGYDEINELYELFDDWKPESKVLKELKFRMNGLRASKL
ncbi:hypothetical protein PSN45_000261 [Yamadazyma tenuis]|uniref:uncharacterized protein n=1 Tax=Candida tenuis TaxID=2315449 RepID=UPI00279EB838|nr:hypothetical protein PSN45_000261 [Yamadazyma tenuis]